ncbi:hypothetical protein GCM10022198_09340 [Klugiella xanthotipulae]
MFVPVHRVLISYGIRPWCVTVNEHTGRWFHNDSVRPILVTVDTAVSIYLRGRSGGCTGSREAQRGQ